MIALKVILALMLLLAICECFYFLQDKWRR